MIKENVNIIYIMILFVLALILSLAMFDPKADIYFDDGSQHLMRAYGSFKEFKQTGTSNVISNFVNGFGYSWDLFYGQLSTYFIIIISIILGSFNIGFKITMLLIMFLSGFCMYKFVSKLTNNNLTACLAGIIYITSPYFFTDIYIRHAIGECMAFVFIPLVFLGLYNLFNTEENHYYLILGAVRINIVT